MLMRRPPLYFFFSYVFSVLFNCVVDRRFYHRFDTLFNCLFINFHSLGHYIFHEIVSSFFSSIAQCGNPKKGGTSTRWFWGYEWWILRGNRSNLRFFQSRFFEAFGTESDRCGPLKPTFAEVPPFFRFFHTVRWLILEFWVYSSVYSRVNTSHTTMYESFSILKIFVIELNRVKKKIWLNL